MSKATIILAGGMSTRFGRSKPFLSLLGTPLLLRSITEASRFSDEIVVTIGKNASIQRYERLIPNRVRITKDVLPQQSPLVGIYTGLRSVKSRYAIILPCDLPFVNEGVVSLLFEKVLEHDAAVPIWPNGNIEPIHSTYNVGEARLAAEKTLKMGQLKVSNMIDRLKTVVYVDVEELRKMDKDLLTFLNINTKQDLRRAEKILKLKSGIRSSQELS
jgi:molybdopterin-guanine dinucleotide biosynthesis protein A